MRGTRIECCRALIAPPAAMALRPSDFTAFLVASLGLLMTYVPAAYFTPRIVNASSATLTAVDPTFHGRTAERQSPRWGTRSGPDPSGMLPSTRASLVSKCIG